MEEEQQIGINELVAVFKRRFWWILIPALLGPAVGIGLTFVIKPVYTSKALVFIEQPKVPDKFVPQVITDQLNTRLITLKEQILSRSRLEPIIQRQGLYKDTVGNASMDDKVESLRKAIDVQMIAPGGSDSVPSGFYIAASADSARTAQQVCSEILSLFMAENVKVREQSAQGTTEFLGGQLEESKSKLDAQDAKLAEFKEKYLGQLPTDEDRNLQMLTATRTRLESVNQELAMAQQQKIIQESQLSQLTARLAAPSGPSSVTMQPSGAAAPSEAERQLADLRSQLLDLKSRYTDQHPDVVKIKALIQSLQSQIKAARNADSSAASKTVSAPPADSDAVVDTPEMRQLRVSLRLTEQNIRDKRTEQASLAGQIRNLEGNLQLSPVVEERYKSLTRDSETALQFYNDLLTKKKEAEVATQLERSQEAEQFGVMDAPGLPANPSFPDRLKFGLSGLAGGLLLGIGLTMNQERRQNFIRTGEEVVKMLGLPLLAELPSVGSKQIADTKSIPSASLKRREEAVDRRPARV